MFRCLQDSINGTVVCEWNYLGSGIEYQIVAGPAFIAIFAFMGIVLGLLGDIYNRYFLPLFSYIFYVNQYLCIKKLLF